MADKETSKILKVAVKQLPQSKADNRRKHGEKPIQVINYQKDKNQ